MSIKTKIAALAVATLAATGVIASTVAPAEARNFNYYPHGFHHGWGIGPGLVGAAVVGGAIAASGPYYYDYHRCGWVPQFDVYGNYIGRVRSCY
jgi:hypothetical protein